MKKLIITLSILVFTSLAAFSQPFYGFQSIGRHTFFVGLTWTGSASLNLGYVNRAGGGTSFRDYSFEWQFPLEDAFQARNATFIAGIYAPIRQTGRPFFAFGGHARFKRSHDGQRQKSQVQLALTGIPSYTFAGILSERPYLTAGTRLTYFAVLYEDIDGDGKKLPFHGAEVGGHLDAMLERTLGLGINVFFRKTWNLQSESLPAKGVDWENENNIYLGPTYNLRRW